MSLVDISNDNSTEIQFQQANNKIKTETNASTRTL